MECFSNEIYSHYINLLLAALQKRGINKYNKSTVMDNTFSSYM